MSRLTYAVALAAVLLTVGCSAGGAGSSGGTAVATRANRPTRAQSPSASPSPSAVVVPSVPPPDEPSSVSERCGGPQGPRARDVVVAASAGTRLTAYDVGAGGTVALLLHQTDGDGCGWWPYASYLAASQGLRAVALDLCGYGRSTCPSALEDDPVRQVAIAVRWVRQHGGRRVVLVGASMGGAVALAAAGSVPVEGVVDLSGPSSWPGVPLDRAAPRVRVPAFLAISRVTDGPEHDLLKAAFARIPARDKRFVSAEPGHGWGLVVGVVAGRPALLPLAPVVADRVRGGPGRG